MGQGIPGKTRRNYARRALQLHGGATGWTFVLVRTRCDDTVSSVPDLGRWRPGAGIASTDGVTYRRLLMSRTTLE